MSLFPPRLLVIAGGVLVLAAMIYGSTLNGDIPYFPNLVIPITVGGFGIGMIVVPLTVSAIAGVGFDEIGPVSAIALMLQNLGGPVVLAIIQAVITSRTLYLGGTTGPVKNMNAAQLHALDQGYTYGLLWVAAVAVIVGVVALFIGYTAEQVAHAQEVKDAIDAGELSSTPKPGQLLAAFVSRGTPLGRVRAMSAAGGPSGSTDRTTAPLSSSVLGIAIVAITGMQLMSTLDGTIVIVALPRMQAELDLSDAGKSWVITAYVLAFGGLLLLGGRVGDAIGHKRAFLSGVGVFTIASLVCGLANDDVTLIVARAVQGIGAAVAAPTGLALIATTYAVGHARNQAMAVSAAMQGIGSVLGLVLGGALTVISWRLAFLINVPIGIVIIVIAVLRIAETHHERLKLDVTGALLATLGCTSAVLVFTQGPPRGWVDPWVIGAGVAAVVFFVCVPDRRAHRRATRWCRSRCSTTATG